MWTGERGRTTKANRSRTPGPTTRPKMDDKTKQPIFKQQDRQVAKDDLDKTKNTNAVELAGLTAMGLGEGDPYPAWKKDDKGNVVVDKDGKPTADPFVLSYKPLRTPSAEREPRKTRRRSISTPAPVPSWPRMDSVPSWSRRAWRFFCWWVSNRSRPWVKRPRTQEGHRARGLAVPGDSRRGLLPVRVFRRQLFPEQRLHHVQCRRFRRAHRGHDGSGGHLGLWQLLRRARRSC